jgi:aryl-alcohol dehydrogenase-like predicted oxidoreductase
VIGAIEGSLERLQVEHIDLYQIHRPARKANFHGPRGYTGYEDPDDGSIEETLETLTELVKEGKVRYIGVSNETPWGVAEYLRLSREKGLERIVTNQTQYSLLNRTFEIGLSEFAMREKVELLAYSPLSKGSLTGKYLGGVVPPDSRFAFSTRDMDRYNPEQAQPAIEAYVELAKRYGLDPAQMALAFVNSRPFLAANIIGARTAEQLETDIASIDLKLSDEVLEGIHDIYTRMPDPHP